MALRDERLLGATAAGVRSGSVVGPAMLAGVLRYGN